MEKEKIHLQFMGRCLHDGEIWFTPIGFNGLFSINIKKLSVAYEGQIPGLEDYAENSFGNVSCVYGDRLFFFPGKCAQIFVYDVNDKVRRTIPIPRTYLGELTEYVTAEAVRYKSKVWVFPLYEKQKIFVLDAETLEIEKDTVLTQLVRDTLGETDLLICRRSETEILAASSGGHKIVGLDLAAQKIQFQKDFGETISIYNLFCEGESVWLVQETSTDVWEWHMARDRMTDYRLGREEWLNANRPPYSNIIFRGNRVLLLNDGLRCLMEIDRGRRRIEKLTDYPSGFRFLQGRIEEWPLFHQYDILDGKVWLYPLRGNMMLVYDLDTGHIEGQELTITEDRIPELRYILLHRSKDDIAFEDEELCSLQRFLKMEYVFESDGAAVADAGKRICEHILET